MANKFDEVTKALGYLVHPFRRNCKRRIMAEMDDTKRHQRSRHGPTGSTKRLHYDFEPWKR